MIRNVAHVTREGTDFVTGLLNAFRASHPAAKHDGEEFRYMGKTAKRWRWHPHIMEAPSEPARPQLAPSAPMTPPTSSQAPTPHAWGSPERMAVLDAEFAAEDFTNADERSAVRLGFPSVAAMREQATLDELLEEPDSE